MLSIFIYSFLFGLALAMPVGPVTIATMQRTLKQDWLHGMALAVGASHADITYLIILLASVITVLQHEWILHLVAGLGSLVLYWAAYQTFQSHLNTTNKAVTPKSIFRCYRLGYFIALLSPFNIIYWISVSSQLVTVIGPTFAAGAVAVSGFLLAVSIWFTTVCTVLHFTRHRLSPRVITWLNRFGGTILALFATYSLVHIFIKIGSNA